MHVVKRALIARWVALMAMIGLLALVIATSQYHACPTGCGLRYKCNAGEKKGNGWAGLCKF